MLGKYINQFMADNELSVNEEFFIENMDGNRVLIGCADRYKIEDVDGGILTAAVMNEKDKPPAMLLEAALIDLLRENYLVKKKPFYPVVGEYYYYILQERLSNGKYRYFWREIYVDMLTGQERCYYRGNKQGCIEPYDKERV